MGEDFLVEKFSDEIKKSNASSKKEATSSLFFSKGNSLSRMDQNVLMAFGALLLGSAAHVVLSNEVTLGEQLFAGACAASAGFSILKVFNSRSKNKDKSYNKLHTQSTKEPASQSLSFTDLLTGLGNEKRLEEKFNIQVAKLNNSRSGFALGIVNLDGIKPINDLYGYKGGDELIKQCAQRFLGTIESLGYVFRQESSARFLFLLPEIQGDETLIGIVKTLQDVLRAPFDVEGSSVRITGSFGFAMCPEFGTKYSEVIGRVESALYQSKLLGRDQFTLYTEELEQCVRDKVIMEQALRNAVSVESIKPHFQPIISLQSGELLGFEALARWSDANLGVVRPDIFITLAEERGFIAPLTESLLYQAARTACEWPENLFLSFNLSSSQLVDPSTAVSILLILERAGFPANRLEIEVTETATMSDPKTASKIIEELSDAGIRIAMDDFGTGQSSLGRLRELKLDKVKIDRAFINEVCVDKSAAHIVRAILEMCVGLDLTVVAEGIEDIEQAELLKEFGCPAAQGYLFGKPQNANMTMSYIQEYLRITQSEPLLSTA